MALKLIRIKLIIFKKVLNVSNGVLNFCFVFSNYVDLKINILEFKEAELSNAKIK